MQVSVEKSSALQRKLTVQVPGGELQKKIDARLRELRDLRRDYTPIDIETKATAAVEATQGETGKTAARLAR